MKNKIYIILSIFIFFQFPLNLNAKILSLDRFGFKYNLLGLKLYGQNLESGLNFATEQGLSYKINKRFGASFIFNHGFFSGVLTDTNKSFSTEIVSYDLLGDANLYSKFGFTIFSTFGMGLLHYQHRGIGIDSSGSFLGGNIGFSFTFGTGISRKINSSLSAAFNVDYHFTTSNDLDEMSTGNNNSYLCYKFGVIYHFKSRAAKDKKSGNDVTAQINENPNEMLDHTKNDEVNNSTADLNSALKENNELQVQLEEKNEIIYQKEQTLIGVTDQLSLAKDRIIELENRMGQRTERATSQNIAQNNSINNISSSDIQAVENAANSQKTQRIDFNTIYEKGIQFIKARKYNEAIVQFNLLLENFPDHKEASDCQYFLGLCYFVQNNMPSSIEVLRNVEGYAQSTKKDAALYLLGRCYIKQNNSEIAKRTLNQLIKKYPNSSYRTKAQQLLNR